MVKAAGSSAEQIPGKHSHALCVFDAGACTLVPCFQPSLHSSALPVSGGVKLKSVLCVVPKSLGELVTHPALLSQKREDAFWMGSPLLVASTVTLGLG